MIFTKGDILWVANNLRDPKKLRHPVILWDDHFNSEENEDFNGIMLTHTQPTARFENILMSSKHFTLDNDFKSSNSHFVNQLFIKFIHWGPFELAGKISEEGINFVTVHLSNTDPIQFEEYIKGL